MKLNYRLIFIIPLFITSLIHGQDIEFKSGVPNQVQVGDEFFLSYKINRKASGIKLEGNLADFRLKYGPSVSTSNSTSISNGVITKTKKTTFSYCLIAQKTGFFNLPGASIVIDSAKYFSDSVSVNVIEKDTSSIKVNSGSGKIIAKLTLSKDTVYKQEQIYGQLKLYSDLSINSIENLEIIQSENFLFYELDVPKQLKMKPDTLKGEMLRSVLLKRFLLVPIKTGEFNIEKIKVDCRVRKTEPKKSSAFDDFFKSPQTELISVYSDSVKIIVQDYMEKIPNDFTYVAGEDIKISVSLDKPIVDKNELFKYSVRISGVGNLKLLSTPIIQFPNSLKLISSEYSNNLTTDSIGIHGEREFSYTLYSDTSGKFEIPSFTISYLDIVGQRFNQLRSPTVLLRIKEIDSNYTKPLLDFDKIAKDISKEKSKFATIIIMDLSASMLAQDLLPNRRVSVINAISDFVSETNQNIGIIAYSLIPHLLVSNSVDKSSIIDSLMSIDSLKLGDGTSTGMALCMGLDELRRVNARFKNLILLTDGESNKGAINQEVAFELACYFNIPINVVGISAEAEFVPITIDTDIFLGKHSTTIPVQIDDEKLNRLSNSSGGKYYRVVDNETLEQALKDINKHKKNLNKNKPKLVSFSYSIEEVQSMINLLYQDIEREKGLLEVQK